MKFIKPFAALMLALLFAATTIAQTQEPKANGGAPKLALESPVHDFGQIKAGAPLRYAFKIKNEGSADLLIQNVQPG
ncbi:MAG: DUF1573 domain-containing protein [Blastocatellia bacterium]